ncbi:glycoside hydrolase family 88 protein [Brooklawnia cerclae]|uniref:Unsaturated chondroitin disaccharide hydrolase n=1 Tax=Brooklawnia cerclae TaxID=349934 RepID=A0ABX0SPD4_9ACTN|nr:glycoside hydrolase family 88 protein [Brooklawnia cerclae]NIH58627.1 unsaturated chondroitin disaccharide hydrolase [Brooklawnia cerclae]
MATALATVDANLAPFAHGYPDDTTVDGRYRSRPATAEFPEGANRGWTTGFWPGQLWLAWELTGEERYRAAGLRHMSDFARRVAEGIDLHTHDLGFLYTLSCVVPYELLGDDSARRAALLASDHLMSRYVEPAGIIQAWGDLSDPDQQGRAIIDSLMNMPLLYWASRVSGEDRYARVARTHAGRLRDTIIRPDDSTFHTFFFDTVTGEPLRGATQQGYADDSCWARGQAWGIYGFSVNYRHTGDETFLQAAERCAAYFLDHLPTDQVAYWDLVFSDGSGQPRDSSAAAIAACGLLELGCHVAGDRADRYRAAAEAMVDSLAAGYAPAPGTSDALLLGAVYDMPKLIGVDEGCLWGDYFYLEALARIARPQWHPYW